MSAVVAMFEDARAMVAAGRMALAKGFTPRDALTPYPVAEFDTVVPPGDPRLRPTMALAGFGTALLAFMFETWTAVFAYPFNSGGRPLFSWPVFVLVPFEVGVLAAGIAGWLAFLHRCGLPQLYHSLFDVADIERASQDRFFLVLDGPPEKERAALQRLLTDAGAISIAEAAT